MYGSQAMETLSRQTDVQPLEYRGATAHSNSRFRGRAIAIQPQQQGDQPEQSQPL